MTELLLLLVIFLVWYQYNITLSSDDNTKCIKELEQKLEKANDTIKYVETLHNRPLDKVFGRVRSMGLPIKDLSKYSNISVQRINSILYTRSANSIEFNKLCLAVGVDPAALYQGLENKPNRNIDRFKKALGVKND